MGCCQSTPSDDDSTFAVRQPEPINGARIRAPDRASISSVNSRRPSYDVPEPRVTGVHRPNKAIRSPSPSRTSPSHLPHLEPPWTRAQLQNERAAFFETRVTGRPEVWNALRVVCEMLQQDNVVEAQGIIDAINVTCPNGRVAAGKGKDRARGGVYDEFGELYELPAWIVADPQDIIEDEEKVDTDRQADVDEEQAQSESKGKGRAADLGEITQLRARLSDRSTDVTVSVGTKEKVAAIVQKIQEQIGAKRLRLVYLGRVLHETKTLEAQNYRPGDVVNAYVFDGPEDFLRKQQRKK